ncbi:tyrosine-type recombinase/integrase [Azospirillum brasilense]|uniref:tyrosine-type recombinase/integrase n=1 Tax=Azospirillum brasilense TaxID=192 RepID=UPI0013B43A58|nr:site-specific integrase [Azospirillum brasilense]
MPKVKLTTKAVEAAKPLSPGQRLELFDTALPGFGLRVGDTNKTWFVFYRLVGKQKRFTLGHFPALSLSAAREAAGKALEKVEHGEDPAAEKEAAKARAHAALEQKAATGFLPDSFGSLASIYIRQECPGLRRGSELERIIDREIQPAWKDRPAADLRRRDLTALLDPFIIAGHVQKAHKVREIVVRIVNWAVDRGDLEANLLVSPSRGRKRSGILRREKRERVLSAEELAAVWAGCEELTGPFPAIVKTLILTGQRREEVGAMRWAELDLDNGLWTIPSDRYKTGIVHVVPLTEPVKKIITGLHRLSDDFVFATKKDSHFSGYSKCKARLDAMVAAQRAKAGLPDIDGWTLHDLRRTLRTGLSELRVNSDIAERVVGHVIGGVQGVYDRHAYLDEKRDALERWAAKVVGIVNPPPANVVQLHPDRAAG